MASGAAILAVRIIGDSTGAQKALGELNQSVGQAEANTSKSGKNMAGVWAAVASGMALCSKQASALEQSTGALEQVFGESADTMLEWAEGMSAYGLSTAQAAQAAAVLGAQLQNLGASQETAAKLTQELTVLAADMAAVMGGTAVDALGALGAAMRGEFDTLERYGITLTAATVEAEAMALASQGVTFASEQQAKAVATLSLIQQQSTAIQGAAIEESDTFAASTQRLRAEISNLAAAIGGPLNAVLGPIIGLFADVIGKTADLISNSELLTAVTNTLSNAMDRLGNILNATIVPVLDRVRVTIDNLARLIDTYVMPVVDALSNAFDALGDALNSVIGVVQNAINWFENLIATIHEAIDSLTFWNDTYAASTSLSAPLPPVPAATRGVGALAAPTPNVTVNVTAGVGDPHAIAREIRRILKLDAARMGRHVVISDVL
jgi:phage-related protein